MNNDIKNDNNIEQRLAERLRSDADRSRPTFDQATCDRLCESVFRRAESEKPRTDAQTQTDHSASRSFARRPAWAIVAASLACVALYFSYQFVMTPEETPPGPGSRPEVVINPDVPDNPEEAPFAPEIGPEQDPTLAVNDDPSDSQQASNTLCEVLAMTTDTPSTVRAHIEELSWESPEESLVADARTVAGELWNRTPWGIFGAAPSNEVPN